ncbi:MAG: DNA repair protein RecO [Faecalibacterium sp.]|nr:DNA repair protein RecO [Faecalibacterium sp.]
MDAIVTPGLVLREVKYREADKIITLLTPQHGVVTALAKGSLRLKNKLFSACGLFCYSEFTLFPGKNMFTVDEAQIKNVFHGLSSSVEAMSLAMYMAETVATLEPTGDEAASVLRLTLNSLYLLSEGRLTPQQIKAVFELRVMSECGYLPKLLCCAGCSKYDGGAFYLDLVEGDLLCADCAVQQGKSPNLDAGALYAVRHICLVEEKKIFSFTLTPDSMRRLSNVAEQYALIHLDKPLKSYDFLKTVLP